MLESHRQEMLAAMGVKPLLPRFQLVAAKTSSPLLADAEQTAVIEKAPLAAPQPQASVATPSEEALTPAPQTASAVTEETTPPTDAADLAEKLNVAGELSALSSIKNDLDGVKTTTTQKTLRYRLRLVRVGELLMVMNQPSLEWKESKAAKQFFTDIYWALTGKRFEYWHETQFDWPPSKHFPFAGDADMASQTLNTFIEQQMHQPPAQWILSWGLETSEQLLAEPVAVGDVGFIGDYKLLQLESLNSYWQQSERKALLWQHLQVVRKALSLDAG